MIKRFLRFSAMIIIIALVIVGLAACSRSASKSPTATPAGGTYPVPGGKSTEQTMGLFDQNGTATAVAKKAALATSQPGAVSGTTKKTPLVVTATPAVAGAATAVPVSPTKAVVVVSTPVRPASYTLQKGEFPFCIARRFNINPGQLLSINGLNLNSQVYPGTVLRIPQGSTAFPGNRALLAHPADYTVKAGDTIYTVACLYGDVSPEMIAQANSLSSPYTLTSGEKISIP